MDNLPSNDGAVWTFDADNEKYLGGAVDPPKQPRLSNIRSLLPSTLAFDALPAPEMQKTRSLVTHVHGTVDVRGCMQCINDRPGVEEMVAAHRQMKKELMDLEAMMRFSYDLEGTLTDEERAADAKL